jgi:two-component sensor histidine kinase
MNRLCGRGFLSDTENLNPTWLQEYILPEDQPYVTAVINEAIRTKSIFELEHRVRQADGSIGWTSSRAVPLLDKNGEIIEWFGASSDITERKQAEEALAKMDIARQKEIHHRIKNNLQVISSLLDLTAERFNNRGCIQDSEVLKAFRESQDRVISMALIHEELYKGEGFETLNFSSYIEELAENLLQTYVVGNLDINLKMNLEENAFFDMDTAVPLGMIVNELVSNSLKHAFPDRKEGEIRIELYKEENGECTKSINEDCKITNFVLTVSDNGVGIPEKFDMESIDTLGMQLVTSLVDQLDGELELKRDNGTEFSVRFTVTDRDNQSSAQGIKQSIE